MEDKKWEAIQNTVSTPYCQNSKGWTRQVPVAHKSATGKHKLGSNEVIRSAIYSSIIQFCFYSNRRQILTAIFFNTK